MKHVILSLAIGVLFGGTWGCRKKPDGSAVQSVDSIVEGKENIRHNIHCGTDGADATTTKDAVKQVLNLVPKAFKQVTNLEDSIQLAPAAKVTEICKAVFEYQAGDLFGGKIDKDRALKRLENLGACWSFDLAKRTPTIHIADDVDAIHNNLLAMVTYLVVELYADRVGERLFYMTEKERDGLLSKVKVDGQAAKSEDALAIVKKLRDQRERLAVAVVKDLQDSDRDAVLKGYEETFGVTSPKELEGSRFAQNLFYAESIESYYCSDKTRALFKERKLNETWKVIEEIATDLNR